MVHTVHIQESSRRGSDNGEYTSASSRKPVTASISDDTVAHNGRTANGSNSLTSRHDNTGITRASTSGTTGESRTSTSSARSVPGVTKVSEKKVRQALCVSLGYKP